MLEDEYAGRRSYWPQLKDSFRQHSETNNSHRSFNGGSVHVIPVCTVLVKFNTTAVVVDGLPSGFLCNSSNVSMTIAEIGQHSILEQSSTFDVPSNHVQKLAITT